MNSVESYLFESIISDIVKNPPEILMVDTSAQAMFSGKHFDFVKYFSQDRQFTKFFKYYEFLGKLFCFNVFMRKKAGPGSTQDQHSNGFFNLDVE